MIGFPSNVLVVADYPKPRFEEDIRLRIDFVLSCGDVDPPILEEIYLRFRKPIFAVKGNHDSTKPFPDFVTDVHLRFIQHRNWLIGGLGGVPAYMGSGAYEWDDLGATAQLDKLPYVDIFICHAPVLGLTDKDDAAHQGSEAIRRYIESQQPKFVYHGHVHAKMGAMVGETAVVSVYGSEVVQLNYSS
ncbi:MAG: metallophosphoesterase [Candidatus Aminicenantales bacterium]